MSNELKSFRFYRYIIGISFVSIIANLLILSLSNSLLIDLFFLKLGCTGILISAILYLFQPNWLYREINDFGSGCGADHVKHLMKKMDEDSNYYPQKSANFEAECEEGGKFEHLAKYDKDFKKWRKSLYISIDFLNSATTYIKFNHNISEKNCYSNNKIIYQLRLHLFSGIVIGWIIAVKFWGAEFWMKLADSIATFKMHG